VRLLDAGIDHFLEHFCVLGEVHEQLLLLLHVAVGVCVNQVRVVEEQVVLRRQLHLHILDLVPILASAQEHFDADGFERTHLLEFVLIILDLEFERRFSIV